MAAFTGEVPNHSNSVGHVGLERWRRCFHTRLSARSEHPFPAAVWTGACYRGLADMGITKIAITGDSAGGNLALVLVNCIRSNFQIFRLSVALWQFLSG